MKNRLNELLSEFYEWPFPALIPRKIHYPLLPQKATVVMGMRRTGKTWFCYQKMQELIDSGIVKHRNSNRVTRANSQQ